MKKLILLTIFALSTFRIVSGQCSSLFSFGAYFETVHFYNQSAIPNAHYWWNFGDGTGSNTLHPVHIFPETGTYLVTLFAKDTITDCSSYYEFWVGLTKFSTDPCQTSITDSVFTDTTGTYYTIIDNSLNCSGYNYDYDGGPGLNSPPNNWFILSYPWPTMSYRMTNRVQYFTYDLGEQITHREAYKSTLRNYTSNKNYDSCSANFEFKVISEDTSGQRVLFTAMNETAIHYEWYAAGPWGPITTNNDTISQFYPYGSNDIWHTTLIIEGASGCHDTLFQNILVRDGVGTIISVENFEDQIEYRLFPNPMNDQSVLTFEPIGQETSLEIFNTHGQLIRTIKNVESGQVIINRNGLPSSLYYFVLKTKDKIMATGKLVITQ